MVLHNMAHLPFGRNLNKYIFSENLVFHIQIAEELVLDHTGGDVTLIVKEKSDTISLKLHYMNVKSSFRKAL